MQNTGFRKTWTGWERAARSRRWHITLDAPDFIGLQYARVEIGALALCNS